MDNSLIKKFYLKTNKSSMEEGLDFDMKNARAFKNRFPLYGSLL